MSFFSSMIWIALSFLFFTVMVAVISAWKTRDDKLDTAEGYFLAGRGLPGIVIAGSLLLTNLSAEQLVGTNGQGWASNMSPIGWEVGALFTLFALALWFLPTYLKMGTTTIPQLDGSTLWPRHQADVLVRHRCDVLHPQSAGHPLLRCSCI